MVLSSSRCIRFQQDIVDNIPLWPGASVNGTFIKSLLAAAVVFDLHSVRRGSDRRADDLRSLITTHLISSKKNGTLIILRWMKCMKNPDIELYDDDRTTLDFETTTSFENSVKLDRTVSQSR